MPIHTATFKEDNNIMTQREIETTLYYLQRVIPRGKEEVDELYSLIQRLNKLVCNN